jgi:hypothetical protein
MIRKTRSLTRAFGSWYISINLVQVDWYYNKQGVSYSSLDNIFTSSDSKDIWQAFIVLRFATVPGTYVPVRTYLRTVLVQLFIVSEWNSPSLIWFERVEKEKEYIREWVAVLFLCLYSLYKLCASSCALIYLDRVAFASVMIQTNIIYRVAFESVMIQMIYHLVDVG